MAWIMIRLMINLKYQKFLLLLIMVTYTCLIITTLGLKDLGLDYVRKYQKI